MRRSRLLKLFIIIVVCLLAVFVLAFTGRQTIPSPKSVCSASEDVNALYLSRADGDDYTAYIDAVMRRGADCVDAPLSIFYSSEGVTLNEGEHIEIPVTLTEDTFGYPVFTYTMNESNILPNRYSLLLDGCMPFSECAALTLNSTWLQTETFDKDRYGNEVAPMPVKSDEASVCRMLGKTGFYAKGMGLYMPVGEHTLTIECHEGPFTLFGIEIANEIEVAETVGGGQSGDALIVLEAEQVPMRNNPNIRPAADHDIRLTPYSAKQKVINYIEDNSYRYAGDTLSYRFTVEAEGDYALALRARSSELANFPVYRTILVDGVIPGAAFDTVPFAYNFRFENMTVCDAGGTPVLMHLLPGEHTLTLVTTIDPLRPALQMLTLISDEMAELSLEITKITGGNTDFFRDFALEDFDFHISEDLTRWRDEITLIRAMLGELAGTRERIGALSPIDMTLNILGQLLESPNDLPKRLNLFSQGSSSARGFLVSAIESLSTSPMGLDAIYIYQDCASLPEEPSVFTQVKSAVSRFIASFSEESYVATDADNGRLQVWVNRPRAYLEMLQCMADTTFTPETGIEVDFSMMPDESKLVLANAAGTAPDVALGVSTARVYDLAIRGVLKNLRAYSDFGTVAGQFPAGLLMPAVCDDGVFALPETFNFSVLFYRKDLLDAIGLDIPDSYEDVLAMLPTLHRFGLNYNNFVANSVGYKSFAATTPFLYQSGAVLYKDGDLHVQLDTEEAIRGLKTLTDSFIIYDMDFEINSFYQAFRDGTLPIGTSNYAMYNLLTNAAPEIADKWDIALYPGITDANGEVQRWISGAEQSCFIFDDTDMSEESWRFLSWWMSEETQTQFAYTLQSTMGNEYLWNSANSAAFMNSPWPTRHKQVIAEQMKWIYETPRNIGSYMAERELSNAVNAVVLEGQNLRSALDEAIKRIDRELIRKLEEFGHLSDGELVKPFMVPSMDDVKEWLK